MASLPATEAGRQLVADLERLGASAPLARDEWRVVLLLVRSGVILAEREAAAAVLIASQPDVDEILAGELVDG